MFSLNSEHQLQFFSLDSLLSHVLSCCNYEGKNGEPFLAEDN